MSIVETYTVRLYMGGDIETAKRWLRQECWREGLCVTVEPTTFVYTGGEEQGFIVGLLNYPRFPSKPTSILDRARLIANELIKECAQRTALIVSPDVTEWVTREIPSYRAALPEGAGDGVGGVTEADSLIQSRRSAP